LSHEGADLTDFITVTAASGLRTTPPLGAILRPTVPSPTLTKNSFAALAPLDSPPAIPDLTIVRAADNPRPAVADSTIERTADDPRPAEFPATSDSTIVRAADDPRPAVADLTIVRTSDDPRVAFATTPPHHDSSSDFLASFYATWPESEVFDDTSRRIWNTLQLGFAQADSVYDALDDRQSTLQKSLDARHASLQHATKTDFRHLESYVYRSTSNASDAFATALQRLDRADATLVTSLENLTNMKQQLATTNKNVIDGFSEHAKTLAGITDGLNRQTSQCPHVPYYS